MIRLIELPFVALWRLLAFVLGTASRLVAFTLGILLLVVGALLTITVIGGILGVPLMLVGVILVVRAFF